jgi:hypothetical protein
MPLRAMHRKRNSTDTFLTIMLLDWTVISDKVVKSIERQKGATDATNLSCYPRKTVLEISETVVEKYTVGIL